MVARAGLRLPGGAAAGRPGDRAARGRGGLVAKAVDVVGLYHHPLEKAVVLCVDEKSQIQALDRSQPVLPVMAGMPERRTHDYYRHGSTRLLDACNILDGIVISALHRGHRAIEFERSLIRIDKAVPAGLDVHPVCDNYAPHKTVEIRPGSVIAPTSTSASPPPAPLGLTWSSGGSAC